MKKPVKKLKLPPLGGQAIRDVTAGVGDNQDNSLDEDSSFAALIPKSPSSVSPYNAKPGTLGPIRRVRPIRLEREPFQEPPVKSVSSQDSPLNVPSEKTFGAHPDQSNTSKNTSSHQGPSWPASSATTTNRDAKEGKMHLGDAPSPRRTFVLLSEQLLAGGSILRDERLDEAYNEAVHGKSVLAKHRRNLIKEVGSDQRLKARQRAKKLETERKQRRLECENDEKFQKAVQSVVPQHLLEDETLFKKKEVVSKRVSMGQLMLAMVHDEEEASSNASDTDNEVSEHEAQQAKTAARTSLFSKRASSKSLVPPWERQKEDETQASAKPTDFEQPPERAKKRITLVTNEVTSDGQVALKFKQPKAVRMSRLLTKASCSRKIERLLRARRKQFEALPKEERMRLKIAFEKFDKDKGGSLDAQELKRALVKLGLKAAREQEKTEVNMIIQECIILGDVDFFNFALDLVPRVRERLKEIREGPMREMFNKFDQDGSGLLDREECKAIFKAVCGTNLDIHNVLKLEVRFVELHEEVSIEGSDEVDFNGFQKLILELQEMAGRLRNEKEQWILETYEIPKYLFQNHQEELITLHEAFERADASESGQLTDKEITSVLREYKLMPKDTWEQDRIMAIIYSCDDNGDGELQFPEFLSLVTKLRQEVLLRMKSEIRSVFDKYDRDHSGSLDVREVSAMFSDLGIEPRCRQDQDEIKRLLDEVDEDGNGEFDFDEFVTLIARVTRQLHALHRRREQEVAMELGFSNAQVSEMREAFWVLDHDHNNELTLAEARRAVVLLRKKLTDEKLTEIYLEMDRNENGCLEFIGFMQMFKYIESMPEASQHLGGFSKVQTSPI